MTPGEEARPEEEARPGEVPASGEEAQPAPEQLSLAQPAEDASAAAAAATEDAPAREGETGQAAQQAQPPGRGAGEIGSAVSAVLVAVILVAALAALIVAICYRAQGETLTLGGMQYRIVLTGSMEGEREDSIRTHSLIGIRAVPEEEEARAAFFEELEVGDILTFNDWTRTGAGGDPVVNTHRIVEIARTVGATRYRTQGDANDGPDAYLVEQADVIGVVEWSNYPIGAALNFLCSTTGIVVCLIVPASLILIFEVINIVRIVRSDKRSRQQQETAAREQEIARLRRELEELKRGEEK